MSNEDTCHVCGELLDDSVVEEFEGQDIHQECLVKAARMSQYSNVEDESKAVRKGLA